MRITFQLFDEFVAFVKERHSIYLRREAEQKKPWTEDPILQQYRFCNIYRELDTVTVWIREHWREPHANDPDLWFAMIVARLINWPPSLEEGGYPAPWNSRRAILVRRLDTRQVRGEKIFTGAYMIHADRFAGGTKVGYLAERVLTPIWERRKEGEKIFTTSLAASHRWLTQFRDMGSFMAAQVVADVKYTPLLRDAPDWNSWAAPGPGSVRGLNRVLRRDVRDKWSAEDWLGILNYLQHDLNQALPKKWTRLHAQDTQNCLCEFDKYQRVKNGEGRPRSLYPGGA
jgi:hypothetical protein